MGVNIFIIIMYYKFKNMKQMEKFMTGTLDIYEFGGDGIISWAQA